MNEALGYLIELQKMELALRDMERRRKELPLQLAALAQEQQNFQARLEENRQKTRDAVRRHREQEEKLKKDGETLKKTRERLFEVKTNKEYQAILKEIEVAEERISELESSILVLLDEIEMMEKALKPQEEEGVSREARYKLEKGDRESELARIDVDRQERLERCREIRQRVPPDLLKKFDSIKAANSGLALAATWKEICGGCHMNIQPQLYIELQKKTDITHCPNCQRIIYWYDRDASKPT